MGIVVDKIRELMKKLILLLIYITILTNMSYASFPVLQNIKTEITKAGPGPPWWAIPFMAGILFLLYLLIRLLASIFSQNWSLKSWEKFSLKILKWAAIAIPIIWIFMLMSMGTSGL